MLKIFTTSVNHQNLDGDSRQPVVGTIQISGGRDNAPNANLPLPTDAGSDGFVDLNPADDAPATGSDYVAQATSWLKTNWLYAAAAALVLLFLLKGKKA